MARLTMFEELSFAVRALGVDVVEQSRKALRELQEEGIEVAEDGDVVRAPLGLYHVLPDGSVVRVILHITQKSLYRTDEFNVTDYHKYHLFNCSTLERMESIGKADRYRMASRADGKFTYTILKNNRVIKEYRGEEGAALRFCKNCLAIYEKEFAPRTRQPFDLREFMENAERWTNMPAARRVDLDGVPDVYARDWRIIASRTKEQRGYQCEECGINLSASHMRRFLHAHHVDGQKANNVMANIRVLCILHHAAQAMHGHLKGLKDYSEFLLTKEYQQHHGSETHVSGRG